MISCDVTACVVFPPAVSLLLQGEEPQTLGGFADWQAGEVRKICENLSLRVWSCDPFDLLSLIEAADGSRQQQFLIPLTNTRWLYSDSFQMFRQKNSDLPDDHMGVETMTRPQITPWVSSTRQKLNHGGEVKQASRVSRLIFFTVFPSQKVRCSPSVGGSCWPLLQATVMLTAGCVSVMLLSKGAESIHIQYFS